LDLTSPLALDFDAAVMLRGMFAEAERVKEAERTPAAAAEVIEAEDIAPGALISR